MNVGVVSATGGSSPGLGFWQSASHTLAKGFVFRGGKRRHQYLRDLPPFLVFAGADCFGCGAGFADLGVDLAGMRQDDAIRGYPQAAYCEQLDSTVQEKNVPTFQQLSVGRLATYADNDFRRAAHGSGNG
jgi:hypothetical protein